MNRCEKCHTADPETGSCFCAACREAYGLDAMSDTDRRSLVRAALRRGDRNYALRYGAWALPPTDRRSVTYMCQMGVLGRWRQIDPARPLPAGSEIVATDSPATGHGRRPEGDVRELGQAWVGGHIPAELDAAYFGDAGSHQWCGSAPVPTAPPNGGGIVLVVPLD